MASDTASMFRHTDNDGPPTHPLGLRAVIAHEIATHGTTCDLNHLDISKMTSLDAVFSNMDFNGDISKWDTSRIVSMNRVFQGSSFTGDISDWDVSNAKSMASMFENSAFTGDISRWDTSCVHIMDRLFKNSSFAGDISDWNVSNTKSMVSMFEGSVFNGDLSTWNMRGVAYLEDMFKDSRFVGNISQWRLQEAVQCGGMFLGSPFAGDLSSWQLPHWTMVGNMFSPNFAGILPRPTAKNMRSSYNDMMGSDNSLTAYLLRMPLNAVHIDLIRDCQESQCPGWLNEIDFEWLKNQKSLLNDLGCTQEQQRLILMDAIDQRGQATLALPSDALSGLDR